MVLPTSQQVPPVMIERSALRFVGPHNGIGHILARQGRLFGKVDALGRDHVGVAGTLWVEGIRLVGARLKRLLGHRSLSVLPQ